MTKLPSLLAVTATLLGLAGAAHALEVIYEDDPNARTLARPITDAQRKADLELGNCLKASGGRMTERCAALRDKSNQAEISAKAAAESAPAPAPTPAEAAPAQK
jgi:hypothetical protein